MDELKSKFELYKTVLNHIFVLIVAIGGSVGGLLIKGDKGGIVILGSAGVVFLVMVYGIIFKVANDIVKRMENV